MNILNILKISKILKIEKNKDVIKNDYCKNNNIELIRIKYDIIRNNKFREVLKDKLNIR